MKADELSIVTPPLVVHDLEFIRGQEAVIRWQKNAFVENESRFVPNRAMGLVIVRIELAIMPPPDLAPRRECRRGGNIGRPLWRYFHN